MHAGEYISVDKDAYYLYEGKENICVSFLFDLARYEDSYPFICNTLFVCEGLEDTTMDFPTKSHNQLKGMLIALLKYMTDECREERIAEISARIVGFFVEYFDIFFFHTGEAEANREALSKLQQANDYMHTHLKEKIGMGDLAKQLNFTEGYMSEYMRKYSIGFRSMMGYIRANESEHYLMNTDKTILEISEECGFSDVKYYYSAFRRWYKCTPKQFRDQYRRASEESIEYLKLEDIEEVLDKLMTEHYMETFLG